MLNDQVKTQLLSSQYLPVLLSVTLENLIVLVLILHIDQKKKKIKVSEPLNSPKLDINSFI